jgi:CheY-like chemotaxis protein
LKAIHAELRVESEEHHQADGKTLPLSILVAEDTPANQKVVSSILRKRGHAVTIAQDGREAVELFGKADYDVVWMDVQMPVMDGYQATAAIHAFQRGRSGKTPVVAMTAHAMRGDREKCLEAGMDAYVAKPINVAELLSVVESVSRSAVGIDSHKTQLVQPRKIQKTAMPERATIVDVDSALQRLGGNLELFHELIACFQDDAPQLLSTIETAFDARDAESLQRAAHSLKGLALNFGANDLVAAAARLESLGADGDISSAQDGLAATKGELDRLRSELERLAVDGSLAARRSK